MIATNLIQLGGTWSGLGARVVAQSGLLPRGTRVHVFQRIYWVFLILGTLVGAVVVGYMLYNAYKYRYRPDEDPEADVDRPTVGELPTGGGGGRKLFLSFALSTVIVVSLIAWTYGTLLYVENYADDASADEGSDALEVKVVGEQFRWRFVYPNGHESVGTLRVPANRTVVLQVTSDDVFHNFGIPGLRVKTDAIPGETTETWFVANETGQYQAQCYELCGVGHSTMTADVVVMEESAFDGWYKNATANG